MAKVFIITAYSKKGLPDYMAHAFNMDGAKKKMSELMGYDFAGISEVTVKEVPKKRYVLKSNKWISIDSGKSSTSKGIIDDPTRRILKKLDL